MLQAFRFSMATGHIARKSNDSVGVRKACCQISEFLSFKENATTGVVSLNKFPAIVSG